MLATYMGHVSIASTEYYLPFVAELAAAASTRSPVGTAPSSSRSPTEVRHEIALPNALGTHSASFFGEYLTEQRGMSRHTLLSYRDTLILLLRFVALVPPP